MSASASAAAGGAPAAFPPTVLPQDVAVAIRDTVDGGTIPNLPWAVVKSLTHTWQTKRLGEGGFGEVFKGTYDYVSALQHNCNMLLTFQLMCVSVVVESGAFVDEQARLWTHSLADWCSWRSNA